MLKKDECKACVCKFLPEPCHKRTKGCIVDNKKILVVDIDDKSLSRVSAVIMGRYKGCEIFPFLVHREDEVRVVLYEVLKHQVDTVCVLDKMYLFSGERVIECLGKLQKRLRYKNPTFKDFFLFSKTGLVPIRHIEAM